MTRPSFSPLASALGRAAVPVALALACHAAHATLITFDEYAWQPGPGGDSTWSDNPVDGLYDALGVHIVDGYLQQGYRYGISQSLEGGYSFGISFTGTLPKYVSLSFTSPHPEGEATVGALTPVGPLGSFSTGGWHLTDQPGVGPVYSPYTADNVASFHSEAGISALTFTSFFSPRNEGLIDNLYFGAVPAVPEPSSITLLMAGLSVMGAAAWRRRRPSA